MLLINPHEVYSIGGPIKQMMVSLSKKTFFFINKHFVYVEPIVLFLGTPRSLLTLNHLGTLTIQRSSASTVHKHFHIIFFSPSFEHMILWDKQWRGSRKLTPTKLLRCDKNCSGPQ